jgi:hypothetical protein
MIKEGFSTTTVYELANAIGCKPGEVDMDRLILLGQAMRHSESNMVVKWAERLIQTHFPKIKNITQSKELKPHV